MRPTISARQRHPLYLRTTSGMLLSAVIAISLPVIPITYAAEGDPNAAPPLVATSAYRIEPGDILDISVVDEPQLTKLVTVVPDGTIAYPYLGEVKVAGLTTGELRRRITAALERQLVRPQVTVAISKRRETSVSVLGAVKSPGKRVFQDGWRVLDVLADCGGLTVRPEWASATLVRDSGSEQVNLNLVRLFAQSDTKENPLMVPGDILLVQEKEASQTQVQVVGEVLRPGPVAVPENGSVVTVMNMVGGSTPNAALTGVTILRAGQTIPLNLMGYSDTGQVPGNVRLQPGDTLVVPRNKKQFAVLGAVVRPGLMIYPEGSKIDIISALTLVGGANTDADLKGSLIIRKANAVASTGSQEPVTISVDLSKAFKKGSTSLNLVLEPSDILYIPNRRVRNSGLAPLLSVVPFIGLLAR